MKKWIHFDAELGYLQCVFLVSLKKNPYKNT